MHLLPIRYESAQWVPRLTVFVFVCVCISIDRPLSGAKTVDVLSVRQRKIFGENLKAAHELVTSLTTSPSISQGCKLLIQHGLDAIVTLSDTQHCAHLPSLLSTFSEALVEFRSLCQSGQHLSVPSTSTATGMDQFRSVVIVVALTLCDSDSSLMIPCASGTYFGKSGIAH